MNLAYGLLWEKRESANGVQILEVAVDISLHANALGKDMNQPILNP